MINRAMHRFANNAQECSITHAAMSVFIVHGIASIPLAIADDGRNKLPKKQHKDSEAPFLTASGSSFKNGYSGWV